MAVTVFNLFPILLGILLISVLYAGVDGRTIEDDGLEDSSAYVIFAVISLVCFIVLLALCGDSQVAAARPVPPWVMTIQVDSRIDTGITGSADGITVINPNTVHRHRKGNFETDAAKWGAPLDKGKHVFEIYWPTVFRGQTATVGVGNKDALMFIKPRESLIGCNRNSWGLDIARRKLIYRGEITGSMPKGMVPEKFYMYVDCDSGTLGFGSEYEYWGAPFNIPRDNFPVFAMVGISFHNAQISVIYRGSESKAQGTGQVNTVVVPSGAGVQSTVVTVVNPNVVQTQHQQPGYAEPPPAYDPTAPPPADQEKQGVPQ